METFEFIVWFIVCSVLLFGKFLLVLGMYYINLAIIKFYFSDFFDSIKDKIKNRKK
jgi:hypothetical protein